MHQKKKKSHEQTQWFICCILHLLWLRISSHKGESKAEKFTKSTTKLRHSNWEAIDRYCTGHHCWYSGILSKDTHMVSTKLNFHLALLKFNTKKIQKENDQIKVQQRHLHFKSTLIKYSRFNNYCCILSQHPIYPKCWRPFPVHSPYWQRGPWNPAGHWHTWEPPPEHFPPLKQVPAEHSTGAHKHNGTGYFSSFQAKDPPELPLWLSPAATWP